MTFIRKQSAMIYFVLTFVISCGGILFVIGGPGNIPGTMEQIEMLNMTAAMVMITGPFLTGILMIGLVYGIAGYRGYLTRLLKWRLGGSWYAVALLTTPVLALAASIVLLPFSMDYLPKIITVDDKASPLITGIMVGLVGGFIEETGWTGFVIPEMRKRYSVLSTGLIVGALWGVWHFLIKIWSVSAYSSGYSLSVFLTVDLVQALVQMVLYRMLLVWIYDRTGSLILTMLMHASLIFSALFVLSPEVTGMPLLIWNYVIDVGLLVIVAVVLRKRKALQPQ